MQQKAINITTVNVERLAFSNDETCRMLGGISSVTLWRYSKRGLISPVAGTNGRLYSLKTIEAFLNARQEAVS